MDPNENPEVENNQPNRSNAALDAAKQQGKKAVEKMAKEGLKKGTQKVAGHAAGNAAAGAFSSVLAALLPYILIAVVVILIIIMIIGIIAFLVTMPGMMSEKLKSFGESIATGIRSVFFESGTVSIKNEEIVELAQYINSMEYDLLGYGFVTPKKGSKDIALAEELENTYTREEFEYDSDGKTKQGVKYLNYNGLFYDKDGVLYNGSTGKPVNENKSGNYTKYGIYYNNNGEITDLSGVNTSYLKTYALSDKRIFILRNKNSDLIKDIVKVLTSFIPKENYNSWANGLVCLYNAKDSLASGEYVKSITKVSSWGDAFEFMDNGNFKVKKGLTNNQMEYSTEGWVARYGLSQDFLISLHLATLSPELVQTIAQSYDTEIQVYLNEITRATAEAKLIDTSSSLINTHENALTIHDFKNRFKDIGLNVDDKSLTDLAIDVDAWYISKKEARNFYKETKMHSPTTCTHGYDVLPDHIINDLNTQGGNSSNEPNVLGWNINEMEKLISDTDPTWVSYNVINTVEKFVKNLKDNNIYGFSQDDYNAVMEIISDNENCAMENAYSDLYPYNPINDYNSNKPGIDISVDENFAFNRKGLNLNEFLTNNIETEYRFQIYNNENGPIFNYYTNADTLTKYRFGCTCAFEYGKIELTEDGQQVKFGIVGDHSNFCTCSFCQRFWNKYFSMCIRFNESSDIIEEYIDASGKEYNGTDNIMISDIYTWDYTNSSGESISYNLSFYTKNNDNDIYIAITRSWTDQEAADAKAKYKASEDTCSSTNTKNICVQCRKHVKNIVKTLKYINDEDYSVYLPYIARVIDSWFRDTYFIIPNKTDEAINAAMSDHGYSSSELVGQDISIIENDSIFLEETGELWTKYLMNPDGDYALFILNTTGELLKSTDDVKNYLDKLESSRGLTAEDRKLLEDKFVDFNEYSEVHDNEKTSGFGRWKGEDRRFNEDEKEIAEELLEKYSISLVKIPISKKVSKLEGYSGSGDIAWSAYNTNKNTGKVWQEIEVSSSSPKAMRKVVDNYNKEKGELKLVVGLDGVYDIVQTQDAQRGITNSKIKYLFKNKKYYKYDGTVERSYAIYNDWQSCINSMNLTDAFKNAPATYLNALGKNTIKQLFRPTLFSYWNAIDSLSDQLSNLKETALNTYIDAFYYQADSTTVSNLKTKLFEAGSNFKFARDFNGDDIAEVASLDCKIGDIVSFDSKTLKITENTKLTNDPRNPDLISNIDLNNESLAAFSILENTKTLDADYAYRDLKELFCELDYFDKEDLTEPAKDVLEWILPDTGSQGWPVRTYDKLNEYGSLIHSSAMYKNLIEIDESISKVENNTQQSENDTAESTTTIFEGYEKAQPVVSPATAKILEIGTVEVTNENTKTILDRYYVSSGKTSEGQSNTSENSENNSQTSITPNQHQELQEMVQSLEDDTNNPLGKTYTTGYIKLEVIGSETLNKFKLLFEEKDKEIYNGLNAFYSEYYNETNKKSICDSYIIYIEGVDLTGNLEKDSSIGTIDDTILGKIYSTYSLSSNKSLLSSISDYEITNDGQTKSLIEEDTQENPSLGPEIKINEKDYYINYYTGKKVPDYYPNGAKEIIIKKEDQKDYFPTLVKIANKENNTTDIYLKAGTLIGLTGESNIKIIIKDKENAVVENVENYLEIEKNNLSNSSINSNGTGAAQLAALTTSSSVSDITKAIIDYFMDNGYTFEAACGVVGNIYQESRFDYKAGSGYHGLFQIKRSVWDTYGLLWLNEKQISDSIEAQCRFIVESNYIKDLGREPSWGTLAEMQSLTNEKDAADYWCVFIEGCWGGKAIPENRSYYGPLHSSNSNAKYYQELGKRKEFAEKAKKIYLGEIERYE